MFLLGRRATVASTLVWLLLAPFILSSADGYAIAANTQPDFRKQMLLYRAKLAVYRKARHAYEKLAEEILRYGSGVGGSKSRYGLAQL